VSSQPRSGLAGPHARRVGRGELLRRLLQGGVIVSRAVPRHAAPVHRFRPEMRLAKPCHHVVVAALRVREFLVDERNPAEATRQRRDEIAVRQVPFKADTLLALAVEEKDRWRPRRIKPVEPCRMLFDMRFDRHEVFVDEVGGLLIGV